MNTYVIVNATTNEVTNLYRASSPNRPEDIQVPNNSIFGALEYDSATGTVVDTRSPDDIAAMVMQSIRYNRNRLLRETDWTQLADIDEATKAQWTEYRQTLRDIPQTWAGTMDATEVVWPARPDEFI